ncbi:MAG: hypothetical protein KAT15_14310, partial [Bacteroidales bacterium]|nr:hypothetical protein [Bacteroidales bacterium]
MKKNSPIKLLVLLVGFFMTSGYLFGQTCPDGMISYWKMQEASGTTYYDSFGSNDAFAPESGPSVTDGASGGAQMFSAASETYLNVPDDSQFDWGGGTSFSIELWVK